MQKKYWKIPQHAYSITLLNQSLRGDKNVHSIKLKTKHSEFDSMGELYWDFSNLLC